MIDRDPICIEADHERKGIVTSGTEGDAHAAVNVCDRPECIEDAKLWVQEVTGLEGVHRPDPLPLYPEHEKMQQVLDKSQLIGDFLEWMRHEERIWFVRDQDEPPYGRVPEWRTTEKLLADYFGINLDVISKEKRDMLVAQRELNKQAGLG